MILFFTFPHERNCFNSYINVPGYVAGKTSAFLSQSPCSTQVRLSYVVKALMETEISTIDERSKNCAT